MTKSEFLKLEKHAAADEKIKLRILYEAAVGTLKEYKSKYSQSNLKGWQAAEQALDDYAERIKANKNDEIYFNTIKEVFEYLKTEHPKTNQSTVYNHHKKGFIKKNDAGKFTLVDVTEYAQGHIKNFKLSDDNGAGDPEQAKDNDASYRKLEAQAKHWEIKTKILQGQYVERDTMERALAQRAGIFKSDIINFIRSHASEMCHLVEGDDLKIPDLIEFWLERTEVWLGRYSK